MSKSTLTERGQISVPSALRKAMKLRPGQSFSWHRISDREMRVSVEAPPTTGPLSVLGYAKKIHGKAGRCTAAWMRELRAGEK